jgi:hypothetical protein
MRCMKNMAYLMYMIEKQIKNRKMSAYVLFIDQNDYF